MGGRRAKGSSPGTGIAIGATDKDNILLYYENEKHYISHKGSNASATIFYELFHNEECLGLVSRQFAYCIWIRQTQGTIQYQSNRNESSGVNDQEVWRLVF